MEIFTIMLLVIVQILILLNQAAFIQLDRVNLMKISKLEVSEQASFAKYFSFKKEIHRVSLLIEIIVISLSILFVYLLSEKLNTEVIYIFSIFLLLECGIYFLAKAIVYKRPENIFYKTRFVTCLLFKIKCKFCKKRKEENTDLFSMEDISIILSRNGISLDLNEKEFERILATIQRNHNNVKSLLKVHRTSIVGIEKDMTLKEAYAMLDKYDYTYFPVYNNNIDVILCVISREDILRLCIENDMNSRISLYCSEKQVYTILETMRIEFFLKIIKEKGYYFWVVLDEYGGTEGIITLTDILEEK